jgi:glutathione S-transferase
MLKIWGRANSINVQKVLWCCGELGLQYDRIDAGNEFGVTKTPEYRALNPNALVPTIEDGDFQLWESNVIVRYLAQKSQDNRLCPADITTRFGAERWMAWQATVFWPALRPLFIELIRTAPANRDTSAIARGESLSLAAARILDAVFRTAPFSPGVLFHGRHSGRDDSSSLVCAQYPSSRTAQPAAVVSTHDATPALSGRRHDAFEITAIPGVLLESAIDAVFFVD